MPARKGGLQTGPIGLDTDEQVGHATRVAQTR
jgi:hypothetical protein